MLKIDHSYRLQIFAFDDTLKLHEKPKQLPTLEIFDKLFNCRQVIFDKKQFIRDDVAGHLKSINIKSICTLDEIAHDDNVDELPEVWLNSVFSSICHVENMLRSR